MKRVDKKQNFLVTAVTNGGDGMSFFIEKAYALTGEISRMLSEQIEAVNFRFRTSTEDYVSDWHVAGDPTLLIILSGTVRISLRDGSYKDFSSGDKFIAEDYLASISFDQNLHGHRAEVISESPMSAIHLKLAVR